MDHFPTLPSRKADHIRINLEEDVSSGMSAGFDRLRFCHQALPEINLEEVDTRLSVFGRTLNAPILISSMTGGTEKAAEINQRLAEAAQMAGVALGLGSQRAALENTCLVETFQVRKWAPDILLFANLGAIQLNYDYSIDQCLRVVDMVEADGLILHLNPLQEALQPEGDVQFRGLIGKIEEVCEKLPVPVIVKEVGWGISERVALMLLQAGVSAIDVAGAGGTSWSQVEMYRMKDEKQASIASVFRNWGISTVDSLRIVRRTAPGLMIFASGGIRNGLEIAKSIALGATVGGMAGPFLKAAIISTEEVYDLLQILHRQLQLTMFAAGAANLAELSSMPLMDDGN